MLELQILDTLASLVLYYSNMDILTTREVADFLRITTGTLNKWDRQGITKPLPRLSNHQHKRYKKEDIENLLREEA